MREQDIIALIKARDGRGAELLLKHYGPLMRYIIAPIIKNEQDREDCISEAAMRVWDRIGQYSPERGSWNAWLTAVTRNIALNHIRKNTNEDAGEITPDMISQAQTPENALLQKERADAVRCAISQLKQPEQALFYRKYYYMQSTSQIASELGMSERAVEGRLHRIRKKLQKLLGGEGNGRV